VRVCASGGVRALAKRLAKVRSQGIQRDAARGKTRPPTHPSRPRSSTRPQPRKEQVKWEE